jgi:hypothetical protein
MFHHVIIVKSTPTAVPARAINVGPALVSKVYFTHIINLVAINILKLFLFIVIDNFYYEKQ